MNQSWYVKYTYPMLRSFFGPIVRGIWIKEVTGIENIPKDGPILIALNHQSYLDFIAFIAICPRPVYFLSAAKLFSHPFWAPLMRLSGQIKVERMSKDKDAVHKRVHEHLTFGKVVGIFPEGTRSHDPENMLHAFTGITKYAVKGKTSIIPVGIKGAFEVMSRKDKIPKFKKIITVHIGQPIHFTEHHDKEVDEVTYRQLTDRVMLELSRLSGKSYNHIGKMERDPKTLEHIPRPQ